MIRELLYKIFKPYIEQLELEFEQKKLRNLKTYYDMSVRVKDIESFKRYITDTLTTADYKVDISEYSSVDLKSELGLLFQTSKNKPIRILIRGIKKEFRGFKYPTLLAISFIITLLFSISAILNVLGYIKGDLGLNLILLFLSLIITILIALQRKLIKSYIYIKALGIYDIETNVADFRVILAGISDDLDKLKEDIAQIYSIISRKFTRISNEESYSREFLNELAKVLEQLEKKKTELMMQFSKGKISYDKYIKEKQKIDEEIERYRKLIELV